MGFRHRTATVAAVLAAILTAGAAPSWARPVMPKVCEYEGHAQFMALGSPTCPVSGPTTLVDAGARAPTLAACTTQLAREMQTAQSQIAAMCYKQGIGVNFFHPCANTCGVLDIPVRRVPNIVPRGTVGPVPSNTVPSTPSKPHS